MADPATELDPKQAEDVQILERHLLSCCMQDDGGAADAVEILSPGDFLNDDYGAIFEAVVTLHGEGRESLIAADVYQQMKTTARTDVRIASLLAALEPRPVQWFADTVDLEPTGIRASYYGQQIRDAALLRRLRHAANEILRDIERPVSSPVDTVAAAERRLFDVGDALLGATRESVSVLSDMLSAELVRIDDRIANGGSLAGLATGYVEIDNHLGGLRPGQLIVIGGRPSAGKTALGLNILANVADGGEPVLFFSMEMPNSEISGRLLSRGSGVPMHTFTRGKSLTSEDSSRLYQAAESFGACPVYVDDTSDQLPMRILQVCRRSVRRHGVALAVVDYLQLIASENPKDNRTQQVGLACRRMKQIARDCKIPVILLSQLNRDSEGRGRPRLSDLRDSGEIEQHADTVLLLHVDSQPTENEVWTVDVVIAKNRNGPIGDVQLNYRRPVMRFETQVIGGQGTWAGPPAR